MSTTSTSTSHAQIALVPTNPDHAPLFNPITLGGEATLTLKNRIIMAPMTRSRADHQTAALTPLTAEYYAQRASAGLILTEGTHPSPEGKGYMGVPGLYNEAQKESWARVAEAVHEKGGKIFLQIMHSGRIGHDTNQDGLELIAPSAIRAEGMMYTMTGPHPNSTPREMTIEDIEKVLEAFTNTTRLALDAGLDGVELHAASGYLPNQFLSRKANHRTDEYGGTPENHARFVLNVMTAMLAAPGASGRVGIKISPGMLFNDIGEAAPDQYEDIYTALIQGLDVLDGVAYVHYMNAAKNDDLRDKLRNAYGGTFFLGGGLKADSGADLIRKHEADAAVYGNLYVSNPDLVERFAVDAPLTPADSTTFYQGGENGYTDYPTYVETLAAETANQNQPA
jgi:N-ethylmaleimide reductase